MKGNKLDKKNYKFHNYLMKKSNNSDNIFFKTQKISNKTFIKNTIPKIRNISNLETYSTNCDSNNKFSYTSRNPINFNNYNNTTKTKFYNKIISKSLTNNHNTNNSESKNFLQILEKIDAENEIKIKNLKNKKSIHDNLYNQDNNEKKFFKKEKTFSQYFSSHYSPKNYCKTNLTNFITKDIDCFKRKFKKHKKFFKKLEFNENQIQKIKIIFNYISPYVERERNKYENKYRIFLEKYQKILKKEEAKKKLLEKQKILSNNNLNKINIDFLYNLKNNNLNDFQKSKLSLINKIRKTNILYKISDEDDF